MPHQAKLGVKGEFRASKLLGCTYGGSPVMGDNFATGEGTKIPSKVKEGTSFGRSK